MTTPGSTESLTPFERRRLHRKRSKSGRIETRQREIAFTRHHCVMRLSDPSRYGLLLEHADRVFDRHVNELVFQWGRLDQVYRTGASRVVRFRGKRGEPDWFYAVLRPGDITGYDVIVTYLTEGMVFNNVMGEGEHALRAASKG